MYEIHKYLRPPELSVSATPTPPADRGKALEAVIRRHPDWCFTSWAAGEFKRSAGRQFRDKVRDTSVGEDGRTKTVDAPGAGAEFHGETLVDLTFRQKNIAAVSFNGAMLRRVSFAGKRLQGVTFDGARLDSCDFTGAVFERGSSLRGARIGFGCKFDNVDMVENLLAPAEGAFTAYKKATWTPNPKYPHCRVPVVLTLEVLATSKRTTAYISRKCRTDAVRVTNIEISDGGMGDAVRSMHVEAALHYLNTTDPFVIPPTTKVKGHAKKPKKRKPITTLPVITEATASYDRKFKYKLGEVAKEPGYDPRPDRECSSGIHFFMTRREAEAWAA